MNGNSPEPLLKPSDVAQWLRVTEATIRKWVCRGRIPYLKIGRNVCFERKDIEDWLRQKQPLIRPPKN